MHTKPLFTSLTYIIGVNLRSFGFTVFCFVLIMKFFLKITEARFVKLCIRRVHRALYFHASFGDLNRIWSYRQLRKFKVKVYFTQQCSWWCSSQEVLVKKTKKKKVVFSSFDCESKECLLFMVKAWWDVCYAFGKRSKCWSRCWSLRESFSTYTLDAKPIFSALEMYRLPLRLFSFVLWL